MSPRYTKGIALKKQYGQHFLRQQSVARKMVDHVDLNETSSVFEIGCGDGFLTRIILEEPIARLWVFEIDPEWATYVREAIPDKRLEVFVENILDVQFSRFESHKPWILLANLPYQVTFPILHVLQRNRHLLKEGVIMVQEEVAQKIVKQRGRGYGFISLFLQWHFEWKLLDKVSPNAFYPPPSVFSRLLYFKPKEALPFIPEEESFWKFIKVCFKHPRRTLRNNLIQAHFDIDKVPPTTLVLRAQQMSMDDLINVWNLLIKSA